MKKNLTDQDIWTKLFPRALCTEITDIENKYFKNIASVDLVINIYLYNKIYSQKFIFIKI